MTSFTSRTQRLTRVGIAALAVCTCLVSYSASAEPRVKSEPVSFADLDLSKPAGAQTLYKRIQAAARRVCGPADRYTHLTPSKVFRECYETAIADAVAQVDRPSLTALHKEQASRTARG
ncbi:MAG: UrcA family protein [Steroidobacteraceae bacterium]